MMGLNLVKLLQILPLLASFAVAQRCQENGERGGFGCQELAIAPIQGRGLKSLTAADLPELATQIPGCALNDSCPHLWYATSPAGDINSCRYTGDATTDGVYVLGGYTTVYTNDMLDTLSIGARSAQQFSLIYEVQRRCTYRVCLVFRELYWTSAGKRVFSVYANEYTVLQDLDIWATTGARVTPFKYCFDINVTNTQLTLLFNATTDEATVSEISVCQTDCAAFRLTYVPPIPNGGSVCRVYPTPPPNYQYALAQLNVGANALCGFTADGGIPLLPLLYQLLGIVLWVVVSGGTAVNPLLQNLLLYDVLRSYRWGAFSYSFPAKGGYEYQIRLTFLEPEVTYPADRVFSVLLNGVPIASGLDVFSMGGDTQEPFVLLRNWRAPVSLGSGTLTLRFVPLNGQAFVNTIEVYLVGSWTGTGRKLQAAVRADNTAQPAILPAATPLQQPDMPQVQRKLRWDPSANPCTDTPYDPGNCVYTPFANKPCPDLVNETEIFRGMGAYRTDCSNQKAATAQGDWNVGIDIRYPCCAQCRWHATALSSMLTDLDLVPCPPCVKTYYEKKYGGAAALESKVLKLANFQSPRCPNTTNDGVRNTWVYRAATDTCYLFSNQDHWNQYCQRTISYQDAVVCCMYLGGQIMSLTDAAEEKWVQSYLLWANGMGPSGALVGTRRKSGDANNPWIWDGTGQQIVPRSSYVNGGIAPTSTVFNPATPNPVPDVPQCAAYLSTIDIYSNNAKRWRTYGCGFRHFICEAPGS